jgi:hypothetical protein
MPNFHDLPLCQNNVNAFYNLFTMNVGKGWLWLFLSCWIKWLNFIYFLFDTVRTWEFSPVWTDFNKCHNLSKRNVKLILKILSDLEPLRGSSNKKTLYSIYTKNSLNKLLLPVRNITWLFGQSDIQVWATLSNLISLKVVVFNQVLFNYDSTRNTFKLATMLSFPPHNLTLI